MTKSEFPVPKGLPACLASSQEGFDRLCKVLGIRTRADRQRISNQQDIKRDLRRSGHRPRGRLRTADRMRLDLTTFYSLPDSRRNLWRFIWDQEARPGVIPSLEQCVIVEYDEDLLDAEIDEDALLDCQDLFDTAAKSIDWQCPALAVLPVVRNDILNWAKLDSERQEQVVLVAFAVATILDDARLIIEATNKIDVFANEFSFALNQSPEQDEDTDEPVESLRSQERIADDFRDACSELADTASKLVEVSSVAVATILFNNLSNQVDDVLRLRKPVLAFLTPSAEDLLYDVAQTIKERTSDVPSLAQELDESHKIHELWKRAYPHESADIDQLQSDIKRVKLELPETISGWFEATNEVTRLERECEADQAQASISQDRTHRIKAVKRTAKLFSSLHKAMTQQDRAMAKVLKVASPTVHEPDVTPQDQSEPSETDEEEVIPHSARKTQEAAQNRDEQGNDNEVVATDSEPGPADPSIPLASKCLPIGQRHTHETDKELPRAARLEQMEQAGSSYVSFSTALWRAIAQDRLGIAYHIALLAQEDATDGADFPPSDLIAAAAMGDSVNNYEGNLLQPLAKCLSAVGENSLKRNDEDLQDALNLMLLPAALFPTLFAPATGALSMLRRFDVSTRFSRVSDFVDAIVRGAQPLQTAHFGVRELQSALDETAWTASLEDLVNRVETWREEASARRVLFGPAQRVWRFWQRGRGILNELAGRCCKGDKAAAPRVREILKELEEERRFKELVHNTDRNDLGRNTGSNIEARALTQLGRSVEPIIGLAKEWLRLMKTIPNPDGFIESKVKDLAQDLARHGSGALDAIDAAGNTLETSLPLSAALVRGRASIKALINVFEGEIVETFRHVNTPALLLSKDLLFVTDLDYDMESGAVARNPELLRLLTNFDDHASTLKAAFDARLARGDLAGAAFACDEMGVVGDPR